MGVASSRACPISGHARPDSVATHGAWPRKPRPLTFHARRPPRPAPPLPQPAPAAARSPAQPGAMAELPAEAAPAPAAPTPAPALPLPPSAPPGGSQRLLFSHDLVSGRYRGSVRFGLVRLIHGEDSDSEEEETAAAPGGGGRGAGGAASSGGSESGGPGAGGTEEGRASPLRRGYVRVQWYPEGIKQHVKETKVRGPGGGREGGLGAAGWALGVEVPRWASFSVWSLRKEPRCGCGAVREARPPRSGVQPAGVRSGASPSGVPAACRREPAVWLCPCFTPASG